MATVIGKSAKKQFPAYVGELWSMFSVCWRYIADFMKT